MSETSKTKTEQFAEALNKFSSIDEAKSHFKEIAEKLGCASSLGYKAMKQTKFVKEAPAIHKPEVPTVKIVEAPTPELGKLFEEAEAEATAVEAEAEAPETEAELPTTPAEAPREIAPTTEVTTPLMLKLQPILERSVERMFNVAIEIPSGIKDALTKEEANDTAILLPILIWRFTKTTLNEEQFVDMTCVTHFGSIILKVFNKKMQEWRQKRKAEAQAPPISQPPAQPPEPEPQPQSPAEPEPQLEPEARPETAPIMKKINQM